MLMHAPARAEQVHCGKYCLGHCLQADMLSIDACLCGAYILRCLPLLRLGSAAAADSQDET